MELTPREFELLLCQFCRQDLPFHFSVEHDVKEIGNESENKRQIDTKISGKIGISDLLICGEARNWNEPLGSESIDGIIGKYFSGEIRANKVILFSNYGFTGPAINRAKTRGIELLEPKVLGHPINPIPHIVGMGYIGQTVLQMVGAQRQYLEFAHPEELVIIKGDEEMSFNQNLHRLIVARLRSEINKTIYTDLSQMNIEDKNVLYELKYKPGFRYTADFTSRVSIKWDFFVEQIPTGILRHLNSEEIKFVCMQDNPFEILNKVLLSSSKINYEDRQECIREIVEKSEGHLFQLCMVDPDRLKTHPDHPLLCPV